MIPSFVVKKLWAVLILLVAVFIIYAPAARNGFVWDDTALILRDPLIRSWRLIPEGFNHFLFVDATASDFYRPIQRLSYTIDYAAFAFRPGPYHITSLLWHSLAAIALLLFAEEILLNFGVERRRRAQDGAAEEARHDRPFGGDAERQGGDGEVEAAKPKRRKSDEHRHGDREQYAPDDRQREGQMQHVR